MKKTTSCFQTCFFSHLKKGVAVGLMLANSVFIFAQTSSTIIDFQGSGIAATLGPNRTSTTTSTTRTIAFDAAASGQLYNSTNNQEKFRGGMSISYPNGSVGNFNTTLRAITEGWEPGKFLSYTDAGNAPAISLVFLFGQNRCSSIAEVQIQFLLTTTLLIVSSLLI